MSVACGRMNLLELREAFRDLFYSQTWMLNEPFMRILPDDSAPNTPPTRIVQTGRVPAKDAVLPRAVDLAHAYVNTPSDPAWLHWIWCADKDTTGQRVFVGVVNGRMELHRHLSITERWGQASWK